MQHTLFHILLLLLAEFDFLQIRPMSGSKINELLSIRELFKTYPPITFRGLIQIKAKSKIKYEQGPWKMILIVLTMYLSVEKSHRNQSCYRITFQALGSVHMTSLWLCELFCLHRGGCRLWGNGACGRIPEGFTVGNQQNTACLMDIDIETSGCRNHAENFSL